MSGTEVRNGALPAADVARFLNEAQVPNLLFGWWAVGLYGEDLSFPEIDFIIPDNHFDTAVRTLVAKGFHLCEDPGCVELTHARHHPSRAVPNVALQWDRIFADNNVHEIANAHFHLEHQYSHFTVLSLFKQSKLLWSLRELILGPVAPDDPTFMLTNDVERLRPRTQDRGSSTGLWTALYPVKTLTHSALAEALLRLQCRDYGDLNNVHRTWNRMLLRSVGRRALDKNGNLLEHLEALRRKVKPELRPGVDAYTIGVAKGDTLRNVFLTLRAYLLANEGLPDIPPHDIETFGSGRPAWFGVGMIAPLKKRVG